MSSQLATNMRNTTDQFMKGWEAWKVEPVMATRAPECVIYQFPASLNIPSRNNDEFRTWFSTVENMLSDCKMTTHDYFASTEDRRAWLHCSMTSTRHGGSYENEYMFVLSFDEAGEKITKIVEMVDSQRVREAWANVSEVEFKRD